MFYEDFFVPRPGVEPGWVAPLVFETSASTDSAIWASNDGAKVIPFFESARPIVLFFIVEGRYS